MSTPADSIPSRQDANEYSKEDNIASSPHRRALSLEVQSRQREVQSRKKREVQSRQGESDKTNGLAPLSFDFSVSLTSLCL